MTCGISHRFQWLSPCIRQVAHTLLTRPPLRYSKILPKLSFEISSFDLHVLSTPPAFILSQDQTLKLKSSPATDLSLASSLFDALASGISGYGLSTVQFSKIKLLLTARLVCRFCHQRKLSYHAVRGLSSTFFIFFSKFLLLLYLLQCRNTFIYYTDFF